MDKKNTSSKKTKKTEHKKEDKKQESKRKKPSNMDILHFSLLAIIIISGLYFRVTDYALEGIKNDAPTVLTGGLLWFYPHDFFPGLMQYHPPVANYLIAAGCMASGEDFSGVSDASPYFLPTIPKMIGKSYVLAENYCHAPVYISAILVFFAFILLSHMLLEKREALLASAIFALNPTILAMGRLIYLWAFVWLFAILGILSLWKHYTSSKGTGNEQFWSLSAGAIFGLALATKFTLALFLPFSLFIITEKYWPNIRHKSTIRIPIPYIKSLVIFLIAFAVTTMAPYGFSPKNLYDTYNFQPHLNINSNAKITDLTTLKTINYYLPNLNTLDTILLIYSAYVLYSLLKSKDRTAKEKYILYLTLLFIIGTTLFGATGGPRGIAYMFSIPLLMAIGFSGKGISLLDRLKAGANKTRLFYIIVALYIIFNASNLYAAKPYYMLNTNSIVCSISDNEICNRMPYPIEKSIGTELKKILKENETYYDPLQLTGENYFYTRQDDYYTIWYMSEYIRQNYGQTASIYDIILNFNFDNRTIRYIVIRPDTRGTEELNILDTITPLKTVTINDIPVAYIYDVDTLPAIIRYRSS